MGYGGRVSRGQLTWRLNSASTSFSLPMASILAFEIEYWVAIWPTVFSPERSSSAISVMVTSEIGGGGWNEGLVSNGWQRQQNPQRALGAGVLTTSSPSQTAFPYGLPGATFTLYTWPTVWRHAR